MTHCTTNGNFRKNKASTKVTCDGDEILLWRAMFWAFWDRVEQPKYMSKPSFA